jgi:hypothetical protein
LIWLQVHILMRRYYLQRQTKPFAEMQRGPPGRQWVTAKVAQQAAAVAAQSELPVREQKPEWSLMSWSRLSGPVYTIGTAVFMGAVCDRTVHGHETD